MLGVFYFSSTGNSLYIAKRIASKFACKTLYIPTASDVSCFNKVIIVSPIYYFGLPVNVYEFLAKLPHGTNVTVVLNYGGMVRGADYYTYKVGTDMNLNMHAVYTVKMPENFTLFFTPPKIINRLALKSAEKKIDAIIAKIQNDESFVPKVKKVDLNHYTKNKAAWRTLARNFSVEDTCTKCQKCVSLCPAHNILLNNGTIEFLDECVACLGCYHRCPQKAIRYKTLSKKYRYINPNIQETELGKDVE